MITPTYGRDVVDERLKNDDKVGIVSKELKDHVRPRINLCGAGNCSEVLRHLHERVELLESLWLHERVSGLERRMASRL